MTADSVVSFHRVFVDWLEGDIIAALVLSQLFYWYRPDDKGQSKLRIRKNEQWWIAKTAHEWQLELGVTAKQARRAIAVLKEKGYVDTLVAKFDNSPTQHIRLLSVEGKGPITHVNQLRLLPKLELQFALQDKSITETTAETTKESKDNSASDLSVAEIPSQPMKKFDSSLEVLHAFQQAQTAPIKVDVITTPTGFYALWKTAVPRHVEGVKYVAPFTMKEMGMAKLLVKHWGTKCGAVLLACIKGWVAFTKHVESMTTTFKSPLRPSLPYLVSHAATALNWHVSQKSKHPPSLNLDKLQKPTQNNGVVLQTPTGTPPTIKAVQVIAHAETVTPVDDDAPMTLSDLMAYKPTPKVKK